MKKVSEAEWQETQRYFEEREVEAKLGLRLINAGYRILASELHPDRPGGSVEAMIRLQNVRDRLKANR